MFFEGFEDDFCFVGFFFPIGILSHYSSDTINTFWDMLSLIAEVLTPELQGRCVSCSAGWVLYTIFSDGKPYWKWPWAAAHPELSLQGGPSVMSVPAHGVEGNWEKRNLMLESFHCYRQDLATECTQTAPDSGEMDITIPIQAWAWAWLWFLCRIRIKVRKPSDFW